MKHWKSLAIVGACATAVTAAALPTVLGLRKLKQRHSRSSATTSVVHNSSKPHKIYAVMNPSKKDYGLAKRMINLAVKESGWPEVIFLETTKEQTGAAQAQEAVDNGADLVLAAGGDGTINAVAQTLVHTDIALGVIPLGTGNLLARNIQLELQKLSKNVMTALFGNELYIDSAKITGKRQDDTIFSSRFLVMSGIGLDAKIVGDTSDELKKRFGWFAYTEAGVRHLPGNKQWMNIRLDDGHKQKRKVQSVLFANCGIIPGGIDFIPSAYIDDGILDVVVISPANIREWIEFFGNMVFKNTKHMSVADFYKTKKIEIEPAHATDVEIDGDAAGKVVKVSAEVDTRSLLVRVPR